jgi:hypothetical protein
LRQAALRRFGNRRYGRFGNLRYESKRVESIDPGDSGFTCTNDALKNAGKGFRNEMEVGPGGKQIQLEDPDGNPIELFEPVQ